MVRVRWWKRLVYSIFSLLVGAFVANVFAIYISIGQHHPTRREIGPTVGIFLFYFIGYLMCNLLGMVLALPAILLVRDLTVWRFLAFLALGTAIGPVSYLTIAIYSTRPIPMPYVFSRMERNFTLLAAGGAFLSTVIFLLLLRRALYLRKDEIPTLAQTT